MVAPDPAPAAPAMSARAAVLLLTVAVLFLCASPPPASAHVRSTTGFSEISQDGDGVRYELSLEYELLAAAAGLGEPGLSAADDTERGRVLDARSAQLGEYLLPGVQVFLDGVECTGALRSTAVAQRDAVPHAVVVFGYDCPGSADGRYDLRYTVFAAADDTVVDEHVNIAEYDLGGNHGRFVFDQGHHETAVGGGAAWSSAGRFVALGVEHILLGLDHVLFVAALLIGARSLRGVLAVATTFTVAHSVTLGLASLGWVHVPGVVVEPLIALSIAYVAAENVVRGESAQRLPIVFAFGLLHGLGFASTLSFTDELSWQLLSSLLTFNLGIELGQALLVLVLFPVLLLVRRHRWSALAHIGATVAVGCVGLFWFCERLLA